MHFRILTNTAPQKHQCTLHETKWFCSRNVVRAHLRFAKGDLTPRPLGRFNRVEAASTKAALIAGRCEFIQSRSTRDDVVPDNCSRLIGAVQSSDHGRMEGEVLSWLSEQVAEYLQTESLGTTVSNSLWGCAAPYQGESRIQSRCPEREL
jgi:hypothetical protein